MSNALIQNSTWQGWIGIIQFVCRLIEVDGKRTTWGQFSPAPLAHLFSSKLSKY